jgi:predicted regulator of Ras-like GTPase activity (Roadblock/LC7/MglB family)
VLASATMEAARALLDLTEISTQIQAAVMLDERGEVVASTVDPAERAQPIARAARELLAAAEQATGENARERLVQIQAATPEGCVFLVREEDRAVAAVTVPEPTVGLVFYDLKACLRHAAGESLAPKPAARPGSFGAQSGPA